MNLGKQRYKSIIGCGVSLISEMCISVTPPIPPISYGTTDQLRPLPYKYFVNIETYYSVTYLYFSSINNIINYGNYD